jgi:hypothetical protein
MTDRHKNKPYPFVLIFLAGTAAYIVFLRKRLLHWGATGVQARLPFACDSLLRDPIYQSTRAIMIRAIPKDVWSWIVQIGYQRGGFYSYDWLERKAGLTGLLSADQVVPSWQNLQLGDTVSISPVTPLTVALLEPERALVLHTVMNPFSAEIVDRTRQPGTPFIDWTWAFILEPAGPAVTRLLIRVRADFRPRLLGRLLSWLAIEPVHFLMERKMLLGIKERAEASVNQPN